MAHKASINPGNELWHETWGLIPAWHEASPEQQPLQDLPWHLPRSDPKPHPGDMLCPGLLFLLDRDPKPSACTSGCKGITLIIGVGYKIQSVALVLCLTCFGI